MGAGDEVRDVVGLLVREADGPEGRGEAIVDMMVDLVCVKSLWRSVG